jgi:hypothetical protein
MKVSAQLFGSTRSGKPIYAFPSDETTLVEEHLKSFTRSDLFDAHALFEFQIQREISRDEPNTSLIEMFEGYSNLFFLRLTEQEYKKEKEDLNLVTIFDVIHHGRNMTLDILVK